MSLTMSSEQLQKCGSGRMGILDCCYAEGGRIRLYLTLELAGAADGPVSGRAAAVERAGCWRYF